MSDIFDVLETCLQEIEKGAEVESVLASHPQFAAELRPILSAALVARTRGAALPEPSPEAVRRGRAKVLQHAAQMREAKTSRRNKRVIPAFQRFAIAFTLVALFLTSGTGLVSASSSALPGEKLYPVKLTWENVRLFFTFDEEYRETLEDAFENERLHEVSELLVEGRHETIRFAGTYKEIKGVTYVAGIHVVILDTSILPVEPLLDGVAVMVTGRTNAQGFVDVESIELLPAGAVVPVGEPVEGEFEHDTDGLNKDNVVSENENEAEDDAQTDDQSDENSNDDIQDNDEDADANDDSANDDDANNNDNASDDENSDDNNNDDNASDDDNSDDKNDDKNDDDKNDDKNDDGDKNDDKDGGGDDD